MSKLNTAEALNQHFSRLSNCGLSAAYLMLGFAKAAEQMKEVLPNVKDVMIAFPDQQSLNMFLHERIEPNKKYSISSAVKNALHISNGQIERKAELDLFNLSKVDKEKEITIIKGCSVGYTTQIPKEWSVAWDKQCGLLKKHLRSQQTRKDTL